MPDLTQEPVPAERAGQDWWQESERRYRLVNLQSLPVRSLSRALRFGKRILLWNIIAIKSDFIEGLWVVLLTVVSRHCAKAAHSQSHDAGAPAQVVRVRAGYRLGDALAMASL